ncbi:SRPBCC family protein [Phenylobacterium sp.]|uniref:SRPBCC family protein n=1 Tax=Phenylobacterium sp. TaxID=1871053 RepID=UPI002869F11E|nr:SRPBCC family protein [Phenylobacterium sp.]
MTANPALDLTISRVIKAPPPVVWKAWTTPASFEKWWIPEPIVCRVAAMDLKPGGAFVTEMSQDGGPFEPHVAGCYLELVENERLVFTTALLAGWRPADAPFLTLTTIVTFKPHPDGTDYSATAMHASPASRDEHEAMGFEDGWGTVAGQLAKLVEA